MVEKYFLGLDIGTDSIGFAVTDERYRIPKFKGEPVWGVHLFDPVNENSVRRGFRTSRRRLDRRQQRVSLVQELLCKAVVEVDPDYYIRKKEIHRFVSKKERILIFNFLSKFKKLLKNNIEIYPYYSFLIHGVHSIEELYTGGYMDKPSDPASTATNCGGTVYIKAGTSSSTMETYSINVVLECSVEKRNECKDTGGGNCSNFTC